MKHDGENQKTADSVTPAASVPVLLELACQAVERALDTAGLDAVRLALAQSFEAHDEALTDDAHLAADVLGNVSEDSPELAERLREIAATRVEAMRSLYVAVMLKTPINLAPMAPTFVELARVQHKAARLDREAARLLNPTASALRTLGDFNRGK
jgi:hypothetical protein